MLLGVFDCALLLYTFYKSEIRNSHVMDSKIVLSDVLRTVLHG